jgi:hypothetical protein
MANAVRQAALAVAAACLAGSPTPEAMVRPQPANVYFGSLGAYGVEARQAGTPREEFERARIVEGMDFLVIASTPHHSQVPAIAASLNQADRFVAMYAWRYGAHARGAHISIVEPGDIGEPRSIPDGRFDLFYRLWLPRLTDTTGHAPIVQFAASREPAADFGRFEIESLEALRAITAPFVRTIQITGDSRPAGPHASEERAGGYLDYLNAGFRVAPTADSDGPWRDARHDHRTAVVAQRLTKRDVLDSIRARRVYTTDDRHLRVTFAINEYPMGSIASVPSGTPLRIELTFSNPEEPHASYWISLRRDTPGGALEAVQELAGTDFAGNGRVVFTQFSRSKGEEYFLAHIVQKSVTRTDHVWTAPIWLID